MDITFLTTSLGVFGSMRELIENANRLVNYGHRVVIYSDLNKYPFSNWLPCKAELKQLGHIDDCDVLILMDSPFNYHMQYFDKCKAKFKTMIMMGFAPEFDFKLGNELYNYDGIGTEKNLFKILSEYEICADSKWQLEHFDKLGIKTGVAIGGINLMMFNDQGIDRDIQVGWSGDRRPRKASDTIKAALNGEHTSDFYFNKGDQFFLVNFLNRCEVFADNHKRAGWVNPVLEAMACGCVPICNNIPALEEFATKETAVLLDNPNVDDFKAAIKSTLNNKSLMTELRNNAKEHIKQFSYDIVTKKFEQYLLSKV